MKTAQIELDTINPTWKNVYDYARQEGELSVECFTFATANQRDVSFHTDKCRCIPYDHATRSKKILKVQRMDADEQNHTIYATVMYCADSTDDDIIAVFVS